ncbi:hypothetical protein E2C01_092979 [Portunus trituberculatus]|uniref:Uncharacterized protein n=1 Tax=Portunus trituberculatus TaxID=210409 RepID=A0A5B7JSU9_PORTR|nr:hypothetical protein [Portunus trituberculatus]
MSPSISHLASPQELRPTQKDLSENRAHLPHPPAPRGPVMVCYQAAGDGSTPSP